MNETKKIVSSRKRRVQAIGLIASILMCLDAGWLMVPYLTWVSFASVLNFAIWRLNAG